MSIKEIDSKSPEERTVAFFQQNLTRLADALLKGDGIIIALPNSERRIKIAQIEEWASKSVGERYKSKGVEKMDVGDLWNPPVRAIRQSLIVAKDKDGVGACIRLLEAEYWDPSTGSFSPNFSEGEYTFGAREGDISKYFGLDKNEISKLRFLDESDTLYILRGKKLNPKDANQVLEGFLQK